MTSKLGASIAQKVTESSQQKKNEKIAELTSINEELEKENAKLKDELEKLRKKTEEKEETKEDDVEISKMEYRKLGDSGLLVSCLGFGMMSIDSAEQCKNLMKAARPNKNGINFFDHAELYGEPLGSSETYFGIALKELQKEDPVLWRRSDLVITTKMFWGEGAGNIGNSPLCHTGGLHGVNETGLSRKHLVEGMKRSLERLQLDYVDIVYAHRADAHSSTLEVVRSFNELIKKGLAFYWGTSMWPPTKIIEAYWVAKVNKLIPPVVEQPIYNMFTRDYVERFYTPIYQEPYSIGTTTFMPLDSGYLTGKYANGIPKGSRYDKDAKTGNRLSKWWSKLDENKVAKSKELVKLANNLGVSLVQLSLAWCLKNKNVSVLILGGTKPYQITQNLGCIKVAEKLTKENMDEIEKVLANKPKDSDWSMSSMAHAAVKREIDSN